MGSRRRYGLLLAVVLSLAATRLPADEPLIHHAQQPATKLIRFDAHVEQSGDRFGGTAGMKRGQYEVPC